MKFDYGLRHARRKFFWPTILAHMFHTPSYPIWGRGGGGVRYFHNPTPTMCQRGHEMNGLGLGGKPHKIPLDTGLGHLANLANVMFYTLHGFVLGLW